MINYSELKGKEPINWHEALDNIKAQLSSGQIDIDYIRNLLKASSQWVTCAVGNQCAIIPRFSCGSPMDPELDDLGTDFHYLIKSIYEGADFLHFLAHRSITSQQPLEEGYLLYQPKVMKLMDRAYDCLVEIEKRSAELIAEIKGDKS